MAAVIGGRRADHRPAPDHRAAPRTRRRPADARTTTPGSSSPPARPARPRAWPSPTARPPPSSTPRPGSSCRTSRSGPGDRVLAGLSVAFDASCEEMWLAWRHGACLVPAPRVAGAHRHGPRPVAGRQRHHRGLDRADARRAVAGRGAGRRAAADLRRRGLPARARRPAGAATAARSGTPTARPRPPSSPAPPCWTAPTRCASACRSTAGTSPSSTRRAPVAAGRERRADHRRRRAGPLPRPGQGRREVRADADPRLGARLPQRRPGAARPARAGLPGPRRRPGQARRPADRARRDRQRRCRRCPGSPAPRPRCGRTAAGNQMLVGYLGRRPRRFDAAAARARLLREHAAGPAGPAAGASSTTLPTTTSRQGRPRRAALAAARQPTPPARARRARRDGARVVAEQWTAVLGAAGRRAWTTTSSPPAAAPSPPPSWSPPLRDALPGVTVADIYDAPARSARWLDDARRTALRRARPSRARSRPTTAPRPGGPDAHAASRCSSSSGMRWLATWSRRQQRARRPRPASPGAPTVSWWWVLAGWLVFVSPPGRMAHLRASRARLLLRGVEPGRLPARRARCTCGCGWPSRSPTWRRRQPGRAPWIRYYARALGAKVGPDVDLHSVPPVTGLLTLGERLLDRARGRPDRLLDRRRRAARRAGSQVGADATVGARSTLLPGRPGRRRRRGRAGSAVLGGYRRGELLVGLAGAHRARPSPRGPTERPAAPQPSGRSALSPPPPRPARRPAAARDPGAALLVVGPGCCAAPASLRDAARARRCWPSRSRRWSLVVADLRCWSLARRPAARASGWARATTRCTAGSAGRSGPPSGCWTWPAPALPALREPRSRPSGCACSAPRSDATSRPPRCC